MRGNQKKRCCFTVFHTHRYWGVYLSFDVYAVVEELIHRLWVKPKFDKAWIES